MKVRVHELAKKYELKNKEFLEILKKDIGVSVTSHLSNLDEDQVKKIDDYFAKMNMLKVETVEPVKMYKEKKEEKPIRKIITLLLMRMEIAIRTKVKRKKVEEQTLF